MKRKVNIPLLLTALVAFTVAVVGAVFLYLWQITLQAQDAAMSVLQNSVLDQAEVFQTVWDAQQDALSLISAGLPLGAGGPTAEIIPSLSTMAPATDFTTLAIASLDGTAYTSDGDVIQVGDLREFQQSLAGQKSMGLFSSSENEDTDRTFAVTAPVLRDGRVVAVAMGICAEQIYMDALVSSAFDYSAYCFVSDGKGNVVVRCNHESYLYNENILTFFHNDPSVAEEEMVTLSNNLKTQTAGKIRYGTSDSSRYAVYRPLGINGWMIFNALPANVIDANVNTTVRIGMRLLLIVSAASVLFVFIILLLQYRSNRMMKKEYQTLREGEERLTMALSQTTMSIWDLDVKTRTILQNDRSMRQHGFSHRVPNVPESLISSGYVHPDYIEEFCDMYQRIYDGAAHAEGIFRVRTSDWIGWWYEHVHYSTLYDSKGKPYLAIGMSQDVTETQRLAQAVQIDAFTGLLNHASTMERLRAMFANEEVVGTGALLMVDLDRFKEVNDTLGHQSGDDVLLKASNILREVFRSGDVVGRMGGDEFLVFMNDLPDAAVASQKAAQLVEKLCFPCTVKGATVTLSASVGIAIYRQGDSFDELFRRADGALYRSKKMGRNTFTVEETSIGA